MQFWREQGAFWRFSRSAVMVLCALPGIVFTILESFRVRKRLRDDVATLETASAGAAFVGGVGIAAPFKALLANGRDSSDHDRGRGRGCSPDYGPLAQVKDQNTGLPLLLLPKRFEYFTFGWTGDRMSDGTLTPSSHDGSRRTM
jgi:hypothetical protein